MPNSRALQFIVIFWVGMISLVSPFLSILDRIELANVFRAIIVTVVVMASFFLRMKPPVIQYSESFGMACVETMACGVPVIISDKVGIHKEVMKNNACIVVEPKIDSLYKGIKSLL